MSKKMKKIFSFLLVFALTIAININSFAFGAINESVTVEIQMGGVPYINETVTLNDLKDKLKLKGTDHFYSTQPYTNYPTEGIKTPTVADALVFGYNQFYIKNGSTEVTPLLDTKYPYTAAAVSYNWDLKPLKGNPGIYFIYFDGMTTANESTVQNPDGTYTWTGDTWTLYVNGVKVDSYASNITLTDGMKITFDYARVSETWK